MSAHGTKQTCESGQSISAFGGRADVAVPKGARNRAYRTGRYTAEAKAERREQRALLRDLRRFIAGGD